MKSNNVSKHPFGTAGLKFIFNFTNPGFAFTLHAQASSQQGANSATLKTSSSVLGVSHDGTVYSEISISATARAPKPIGSG